ncbi:MAG: hypothetical protein J6Q82_08185 [Clostridia bacterium]|nr:hypothetical protein [Clostridia bacterium]
MNQNKLKFGFGIAAIVFAIAAIALLFVGIFAINATLIKVMVFVIAALCLAIAVELVFFGWMEIGGAPNYFLYDSQTKRNIPVQKLTFQTINGRMNRFLAMYAPTEGKLWTDRALDDPYLNMQDVYKPAVAYKLLYDLAEKDAEQGWKCFELASDETVEFICVALEMNNDLEVASNLRQMKASQPLNLKYVRDYIVKNRNYLKSKLSHYIYDNIQSF